MFNSFLYDEKTFYRAFLRDLEKCEKEVVIESPYITKERMKMLRPAFEKLINKGVKVFVITKDPREHDVFIAEESEIEIQYFETLGVQVLVCIGNHHRKLAILDRKILWEGSLNILSQSRSREIMRRIEDEEITIETFNFLKLYKFL